MPRYVSRSDDNVSRYNFVRLGPRNDGERERKKRLCVRVAAPLTPPGQITRFSRTIFPQHVRQIRKHDVSPVGRRQGGYSRIDGVVVVVVRGGLLPAGNDETDGLLRPLQSKERGSVPQERRARLSQGRRILDEVPPLSVQDKTHFYAEQHVVRVTLLPANTRAS